MELIYKRAMPRRNVSIAALKCQASIFDHLTSQYIKWIGAVHLQSCLDLNIVQASLATCTSYIRPKDLNWVKLTMKGYLTFMLKPPALQLGTFFNEGPAPSPPPPTPGLMCQKPLSFYFPTPSMGPRTSGTMVPIITWRMCTFPIQLNFQHTYQGLSLEDDSFGTPSWHAPPWVSEHYWLSALQTGQSSNIIFICSSGSV